MQTAYNENMAVAVQGQLVDNTNRRVESKFAEEAIVAGYAVQIGTDTNQVEVASTGVYGVAIQHPTMTLDDSGDAAYEEFDAVSVLTQGRVWVMTDGAVAVGAQAYWDATASAFNSSSSGNVIVNGGRFVLDTSGAALTILEIR